MNKSELISIFIEAKMRGMDFVGVSIKTPTLTSPEIIINPFDNLEAKLDYYITAYDDNLHLKACNTIQITNIAYANNLVDLMDRLKEIS